MASVNVHSVFLQYSAETIDWAIIVYGDTIYRARSFVMYLLVHDAVVRRMGGGWAQLKFPGGVTPAVSHTRHHA